MLVHLDTVQVRSKVIVYGHRRKNDAKIVGATSSERFLVKSSFTVT